MTNTPIQSSPAARLMHNGIGVFRSVYDLRLTATPFTLTMTVMAVCERGSVSATIDVNQRLLKSGQMLVLRPGHVVNRLNQDNDFRGFYIVALPEKLDSLLPMMTYMAPCVAYFKDNPIVDVPRTEMDNMQRLHNLLSAKNRSCENLPYNQLAVNALCQAIFYEALGIYSRLMDNRTLRPTRSEEILSRFIRLVEHDFRRERTVSHYAGELGLSPKHLSAVVKSISGLTAGQWIDRKVTLEAKLLLRNSSMTVQEISAALNFANQSFFGKYFRHNTGMSPREFRANPNA